MTGRVDDAADVDDVDDGGSGESTRRPRRVTTTAETAGSASSPNTRRRSSSHITASSSSSGGAAAADRGVHLSGIAAAAASAAMHPSSSSSRRRVRSRPPGGGDYYAGGDDGVGGGLWRHAASSSLLDTSGAASVSDDDDDACDSSSTPMSSEVSGLSRGGGGSNKENECGEGREAGLESLPRRTPLRGFPPEADRKRVVGCLAAVLAVLQSHHDVPGEEEDDNENGEYDDHEEHDPSSSSYFPPSEDEEYEVEDGNDVGDGNGGGECAAVTGAPPANSGGADTTSPPRQGRGGSGTGTGTGTVVGSAESMARYRRRRRHRSAALLRRAAALLFLDSSHARALEPILFLRLAPPPDAPLSTRVGDGEVKAGEPAEAESSPSRGGRGFGSDDKPLEDSCAYEGPRTTRRELLFGSPMHLDRPTPPPKSPLSHGRGLGSLLSSPEDDEGGSESESSPLAPLHDTPTQETGIADEDATSSSHRLGRSPASSVAPGFGAGGAGDDQDAAAAAASLVGTLLGGQPTDGRNHCNGTIAEATATPAASEGEPSPPQRSRTRSRRSELMDGLMTAGAAEYEASESSNSPPSALFADAPPIVADDDTIGGLATPDHFTPDQDRCREREWTQCEAPFASSPQPTSTGVVEDDVEGGPTLAASSGTSYEELIGPFLSQLSPRSGYRCVALLLCHHLLKCPEGYDARVRHALKTLAVVVLCRSSLRGRRGGRSSDGEEAEEEQVMRWATREFESLERAVGRRLLNLSSSSSSNAEGGEVVKRNDGCRSERCDVVVGDGDTNASSNAVVPAPAPSSSHPPATAASGRPTKDQILRGIKITSAGLMAGTLFAVTGGLAAPGIAAGIAAVTAGTTAAATAGTTTAAVISTLSTPAAVTALFGVGGGGLVGYKVQRRTRGLSEFEFRRHDPVVSAESGGGLSSGGGGRGAAPRFRGDDGDDEGGVGSGDGGVGRRRRAQPQMFTVVCLSGWLTDLNDFDRPWGMTRRPRKKKTRSMAWRRSGPRSKSEQAMPPTVNANRGGGTRGCDEVEVRRERRHQNAPYSDAHLSSIANDSQSASRGACLSPQIINPDDSIGSYDMCRRDNFARDQRQPHQIKLSHEQHPEEGDIQLHFLCVLEQFYLRHNPGNVDRAASILQQWRGEEEDLWALLRDKYRSDPLEEYSAAVESQRRRKEEEQLHHPSPRLGDGDGVKQLVRRDDGSSENHGQNIADKCRYFGVEDLTNYVPSDVGAEEVDDVLNVLFEELGYSLPQDEQHQQKRRIGHSKVGRWRNVDNCNRQKSSSSTVFLHGTLTSPPSDGMPSHPPSPSESLSSHPGSTVQSRSWGLHRSYQRHTPSRSTVLTNSLSPFETPSTVTLSSSLASPPPRNYRDEDDGSNVASSGGPDRAEAQGIPTNDHSPTDDASNPPKKNRKVRWDYSSAYAGELYTVRWESDLLMELCDSVTDLAIDVVGGATTHILKQTALHTLLSAFAWPYALINAANMIDGTWTLAIERADAAGVELARTLLEGEAGHRPVTLMGYSMGARAIYSCLKELARHQELWEDERDEEIIRLRQRRRRHRHQSEVSMTEGVGNEAFRLRRDENVSDTGHTSSSYSREPASIVEDAILMGCPNHLSIDSWAACRRVVAGRLVNCYSRRDLILSLMFQYKRVTGIRLRPVCGTCPVDVAGVENYDVSSLISSHGDYCHEVRNILGMVRYGQPRPQSMPIPSYRCDSTFQ